MNKKRLISWSAALIILLLFALYNLSMLTLKTQEAEAQCIRFRLQSCGNSANCCTGGWHNVSHVYTGNGAYSNYFSLCSSKS